MNFSNFTNYLGQIKFKFNLYFFVLKTKILNNQYIKWTRSKFIN